MASILVRLRTVGLNVLAGLGVAFVLTGCAGSGGGPTRGAAGGPDAAVYQDKLRRGDLVEVKFSGSPNPPEDKSERIKDDGTISLPLIGAITAQNKTGGQLQQEIHDAYVSKYYRQLTVTVNTESRYFYVLGEVKHPDRIYYSGQITVLQAVAAAGGFTDFAARTRIELSRLNGEQQIVNGKRAAKRPELDLSVFPGDTINVPRRTPFGG
jgi:polysaccharide export outer membrane protein